VRVLIVSEHQVERARAASMLRPRQDVEVVEAASADEAKRLLVTTDFDVLVVDGDLAPQGGFSALYELHQHAEQQGTTTPPAVVLTARPEDRWLADWARAEATSPKPVDPFDLARTVDALVAARSGSDAEAAAAE
jgi:DNA-binding NarL/FixJ family response regulator